MEIKMKGSKDMYNSCQHKWYVKTYNRKKGNTYLLNPKPYVTYF